MSVLFQREFLCALWLRAIGGLLWEGSVGLLKASGVGVSSSTCLCKLTEVGMVSSDRDFVYLFACLRCGEGLNYIDLVGLQLNIWTRLASSPQRSACFCIPSA